MSSRHEEELGIVWCSVHFLSRGQSGNSMSLHCYELYSAMPIMDSWVCRAGCEGCVDWQKGAVCPLSRRGFSEGVSPTKRDAAGSTKVHWLCMFLSLNFQVCKACIVPRCSVKCFFPINRNSFQLYHSPCGMTEEQSARKLCFYSFILGAEKLSIQKKRWIIVKNTLQLMPVQVKDSSILWFRHWR